METISLSTHPASQIPPKPPDIQHNCEEINPHILSTSRGNQMIDAENSSSPIMLDKIPQPQGSSYKEALLLDTISGQIIQNPMQPQTTQVFPTQLDYNSYGLPSHITSPQNTIESNNNLQVSLSVGDLQRIYQP